MNRQFDVLTLRVDGANVIGMRLGMCKYGYNNAFCIRVQMDGSLVTLSSLHHPCNDPLLRRGIVAASSSRECSR
jgi:hypothetical protein